MGARQDLQLAFFAGKAEILLARIVAARRKLLARNGDDALHNYRVLTRRLVESAKSWAPKPFRRQIAQIAHPWIELTNPTRDLEVERAMLTTLLKGKKRKANDPLQVYRRACKKKLAALLQQTREQLGNPQHEREEEALAALLRSIPRSAAPPLSLPRRLRKKGKAFIQLLQPGLGDQQELHRLRLAAKEIRYGLEPLSALDKKIEPVLAELTQFQQLLGEQRDWWRLADKLPNAGFSGEFVQEAGQWQATVLTRVPWELEKTKAFLCAHDSRLDQNDGETASGNRRPRTIANR